MNRRPLMALLAGGIVVVALAGTLTALKWPPTRSAQPRLAEVASPDDRIAWILRSGEAFSDGQAEQVVQAALHDPSPFVRQTAVFALRGRAAACRDALIAAAGDSAYWVRATAALVLANCPDPAAVECLGRLLNTDPFGEVRQAALDSLARIATPQALEWLERTIPTNDFSTIRLGSLKVLEAATRPTTAPRAGWDPQRLARFREAIERLRPIAASAPAGDGHDEHEHSGHAHAGPAGAAEHH